MDKNVADQHDTYAPGDTHWMGVLIHVLKQTGFHEEEEGGEGLHPKALALIAEYERLERVEIAARAVYERERGLITGDGSEWDTLRRVLDGD
jgi:hypothetical protein